MNFAASDDGAFRHKNRLAEARDRMRRIVEGGATGIQAASTMSDAVDTIVRDIYAERVLELDQQTIEQFNQHSSVVAVGGSGRGEVAPYSDVDIMFLHTESIGQQFHQVVSDVVRDCWDAGLKLGHSVRTVKECLQMSATEAQVATSLIESRHLSGSIDLVETLQREFYRKLIKSKLAHFIDRCVAARDEELHGDAVLQLNPNVKQSPGGLRDIHLLRWVAYAVFQTTNFDHLRMQGVLRRDDALKLVVANEYLTRIRLNLHLHADKAHDLLTFNDQKRIAEERNIEATPAQLPVERLMQEYFKHTSFIASLTNRFVALHRPQMLSERISGYILTRRHENRFMVGPRWIDVTEKAQKSVYAKLDRVLQIYELAAKKGVLPRPAVEDAIKANIDQMFVRDFPTVAASFRAIMGSHGNLGALLRSMHETGVLERIIPDMKRVRCLLQFNEYHSYTVDEHTFRAIEIVESFANEQSPVGEAYRAISDKTILHLAILLHDAGKGFEEDHSEVGKRIAEQVSGRLGLSDDEAEQLVFLVHKHLRMSFVAFHRNPDDPGEQLSFGREVGSPEILRMLFVLTSCDMSAVKPGFFDNWKAQILSDFFDSTMQVISGKSARHMEMKRLQGIRERVLETIVPTEETEDPDFQSWVGRQLNAFSTNYLTATHPQQIAQDLAMIYDLKAEEIKVVDKYDEETDTVEYRVVTHESYASGCSYRIAGVLTAKRLEIIGANITTSMDGIVVDSFRVADNDYQGQPPQERIKDVSKAIQDVLTKQTTVVELFKRNQTFGSKKYVEPINVVPSRVVFDNNSSESCTVIDLFAHDRPGLLYTVCRKAFELKLSIQLAKIATHLDQVVDVFYVTDMTGHKITDSAQLKELKSSFVNCINDFESDGYKKFVE